MLQKKYLLLSRNLMNNNEKPFKWAHEALGLWRDEKKGVDYL